MTGSKSLLALCFIAGVQAQSSTASAASCSSTIAPAHGQPSVAAGWQVNVVASGLRDPRGILFDGEGHLLVVQQGYGISSLELTNDAGACVRATGDPTDIIVDESVSRPMLIHSGTEIQISCLGFTCRAL